MGIRSFGLWFMVMEVIIKTIKELNRNGIRANARTVATWGDVCYSEVSIRRYIRRLESEGKLFRPEGTKKKGYLVA